MTIDVQSLMNHHRLEFTEDYFLIDPPIAPIRKRRYPTQRIIDHSGRLYLFGRSLSAPTARIAPWH